LLCRPHRIRRLDIHLQLVLLVPELIEIEPLSLDLGLLPLQNLPTLMDIYILWLLCCMTVSNPAASGRRIPVVHSTQMLHISPIANPVANEAKENVAVEIAIARRKYREEVTRSIPRQSGCEGKRNEVLNDQAMKERSFLDQLHGDDQFSMSQSSRPDCMS
jgi:hypothetical protein